MPQDPNGGQVEPPGMLTEFTQHARHHGGYHLQPGDLVGTDQLKRLQCVELRLHHQMMSKEQSIRRKHQRGIVIQRAGDKLGVRVLHTHNLAGCRSGDGRGGRRNDDLGPAGAATGGGCLPGRRYHLGHGTGKVVLGTRLESCWYTNPIRMVGWIYPDHERRAGQFDDGAAFGKGQPPRHRLRRRAQFPHRDLRSEELHRVGQPDGDEVTQSHTETLVRMR